MTEQNHEFRSDAIDDAVRRCVAEGNVVASRSEGWAKVKYVVHMRSPLTMALRQAIQQDRRLRHWQAEATPHNAAEEGFTDDSVAVALAFPSEAQRG